MYAICYVLGNAKMIPECMQFGHGRSAEESESFVADCSKSGRKNISSG